MIRVKNFIHLYRNILRWNGESAQELLETVKQLTAAAPRFFAQPLPLLLQSYHRNKALRFDLSRVSEPILAIDKHGRAIVGTLKAMTVKQLSTI